MAHRFLILLASVLLAQEARASFYSFQCGDLTQVEVYGEVDGSWTRSMNFVPKGATVIRFRSLGGLIEAGEQAMNRLRILADQVKQKSGQKLKIVVAYECASACTIFTAGVNNLAREGKLDLFIDSGVQLGFHAGFDTITQTVYPFESLIRYYLKYGVSDQWLEKNRATFSNRDMHWVSARDPWLAGSNLLSNAKFASGDVTDFPIPLNENCVQGLME